MGRSIQHPNCSLRNIALRHLMVITLVVFWSQAMQAKSYRINAASAYDKISPALLPGDTVIWEKGQYNSVNWTIAKNGLVVLAEEPGMVTFGGSSEVKISADKVVFSGFQFKDGATKGNVVEVSGSNVLVRQVNISGYDSRYYLHLTTKGSHNIVEYCNFENKPPAPKGKEGTSIFQVAVDSIHPGYHTIRYCSFKNHTAPENAGGDYGMEALRIGYSYQAKFISRTIVEYCLFTRCNGDGEIISNKARENIFRYNTFTDNGESHLTLRHGSNNVVYGNFFLNGAGIRIKEGQNDMVYNNYFQTANHFALRLENYKVDPLKNIVIIHNTFSNSGVVKLGGKGDFKPENVILANNLFDQPTGEITEDPTGKEQFSGNFFQSGKQQERQGFQAYPDKFRPNQFGFMQPVAAVQDAKKSQSAVALLDLPELNDDPELLLDIAGNSRSGHHKSAGCFEPGKSSKPVKPYATSSNTGPAYLLKDLATEYLPPLEGFHAYTYKTVASADLKLFVNYPANYNPKKQYPAILFFFGGGWNSGKVSQFEPHAKYFSSRGMITILADYRVKSRHQTTPFDAVSDAKSVMRYLRKNAQVLNIDTSRIIASGGSAGGHLAAAAATIPGLNDVKDDLNVSCKPNALVLFNPVFDNGPSGYGNERVGERYLEISPMHNIRKGTPPTIVFLGTRDELIPVESAQLYKQKMEEAGCLCDLFLYDGQKHGFFNYREDDKTGTNYFRETVYQADLFLESLGYLQGKPTISEFIQQLR